MKQKTVRHSKRKIFSVLEKVADNLDLEIEGRDFTNGKLLLYHSGNLLSYGNKIEITITASNPTTNIIKVHSRSAATIQLIDWGTNSNIEDDIIEEVINLLVE